MEIETIEADRGEYLGYVRVIGRRRSETELLTLIASVPAEYVKAPQLR